MSKNEEPHFFLGPQPNFLSHSLEHPHELSISAVSWNRGASKLTSELTSFLLYNIPDKMGKQALPKFCFAL